MHGLVNRAVQCFVQDTYGSERWLEVASRAELDFVDFEAMLLYDDVLTPRILDAAASLLRRERADLMEDLGTYLVSNPKVEALRRLLRFGGGTFREFLQSLDDLPDRARLAVSDLHLPKIELYEHDLQAHTLRCDAPINGFGSLMMGILRAMADDYGALVLLEHLGRSQGVETLSITLVETEFSDGRHFELGVS